jgi:hypothetical protein
MHIALFADDILRNIITFLKFGDHDALLSMALTQKFWFDLMMNQLWEQPKGGFVSLLTVWKASGLIEVSEQNKSNIWVGISVIPCS